jgi:peptidyl-prolyl cis-trans isomerase C
MNKKNQTIIFAIMLFFSIQLFAKLVDPQTIIAEYDGGKIIKKDIDNRIDKLPPMYQARYKTIDGQKKVLDLLITEKLFYKKAIEEKFDKDPEVIKNIEKTAEPYYVRLYKKKYITDKVKVSKRQIKKYYKQNIKLFYERPLTKIYYLVAKSEKKRDKIKESLKNKTDFINILNRYCDNNYVINHNGIIDGIRSNGYIPGVGKNAILDSLISIAPMNEWQGPIKTGDNYNFFKVIKRIPGHTKSLETVTEQIKMRLRPLNEKKIYDKRLTKLKKKYKIIVEKSFIDSVNFINTPKSNEYKNNKIMHSKKYPSLNITVKQINEVFNQIPAKRKSELNNPSIIRHWIYEYLDDKIFYLAAKKDKRHLNLDDSAEFQQRRMTIILRKAYNKLVIDSLKVSDEEAKNYYEANKNHFLKKGYRNIQVFKFDSEKIAKKALAKVSKALKKNDLATVDKVIETMSLLKDNKGIIDYVYQNNIVPGIGKDPEFSKLIWNTKVNELSKIFFDTKWKYVFVRVLEETPNKYAPFEKKKEFCKKSVLRKKSLDAFNKFKSNLEKEFHLKKYEDRLKVTLTSKELFEMATQSSKKHDYENTVRYYDQIIKTYQNGKDDYRALFMKAFTLSENLNKKEEALKTFQQFLKKFKEGELNESAEYMVKELSNNIKPKNNSEK